MTADAAHASKRGNPRSAPRSPWLLKTLDAVLTAPLKPRAGAGAQLRALVRPKTSNANRIAALLHLVDRLAPGAASRASGSLLTLRHFPLAGCQVRLLAYGSGATVFLLENGGERKVLKVFRRSLAGPSAKIWGVAKEFKDKYDKLCVWFNQQDELVVPSQFLLLHGPLVGAAAAAVLQPYVGGKKSDIFLDYSVDEAIDMLRAHPRLKQQFQNFAGRFLMTWEENNTCFDLVGRENLMLVDGEEGASFRIADNGIFNIPYIREHAPVTYQRLQERIEHLRKIVEGIEGSS